MRSLTTRASLAVLAMLAAFPARRPLGPDLGVRRVDAPAAAPVSSGQAPTSGGAVCITGAVWIDHASSFSSARDRARWRALRRVPAGREHAVGLRHAVELERHRDRVREAHGRRGRQLCSCIPRPPCSGGGPSEIDTRGGDREQRDGRRGRRQDSSATRSGPSAASGRLAAASSITAPVVVDSALALIGPATLQNERPVTAGTFAAPQGQEPEILTRAASARGAGPLTFVNGPGGSINLKGWHAGTRLRRGRPSTRSTARTASFRRAARRKGAPLFDVGAALAYRGHGREPTIGIAGSAAISGTHSGAARCLRSATRTAAARRPAAAPPIVDTAPAGPDGRERARP